MTTDDAKPIIRTLRDVLLEARDYVKEESELENAGLGPIRGNPALATLERVDGAIAEADEVLS